MSTMLLLCGEVDYPFDAFASVVSWCPIRHELLKKQGIDNYLFGDFAPDAERGKILDVVLHKKLDDCLHKESEQNTEMRWAPLAIQQIQWPLSRYCWLKECVRNIFEHVAPGRCVISSDYDSDLVRAVQTVGGELHVAIEVRTGMFDGTSSTVYREAPYGLPLHLDPWWFFKIHWWMVKLFHWQKTRVMVESYPNIKNAQALRSLYAFNVEKSFAMIHMAWKKLRRMLGVSHMGVVVNMDVDSESEHRVMGNGDHWSVFSRDEQEIIRGFITRFFSHYSRAFLDAVSARMEYLFRIIRPQRFVLAVDLLDADRLLTCAAKKSGVTVDYLPHGFGYEHYSGEYKNSVFDHDRVLAWNDDSREAFHRLAWEAITIQHPVNQRLPLPLKRFPNEYQSLKILVLMPEWIAVSQGGREDCAIRDLIAIYQGLTDLGVPGSQVHVKYHGTSGIKEVTAAKEIHLQRLREVLGMQFEIVNSTRRVSTIMPEYDLIVSGPTTGIFEAVLRGVPIVLFGVGFSYIGALQHHPLPQARTQKGLQEAIQMYARTSVSEVYARLAKSLQAGAPLDSLRV